MSLTQTAPTTGSLATIAEDRRAFRRLPELKAAPALAAWHRSFEAAWNEIWPLGFHERFRKLWKFYLSYCEAGFRTGRTDVVQLSLAKA
jgi:cyclopropane fatty-acyl-phospholipid synthase-like methyltransferase